MLLYDPLFPLEPKGLFQPAALWKLPADEESYFFQLCLLIEATYIQLLVDK